MCDPLDEMEGVRDRSVRGDERLEHGPKKAIRITAKDGEGG